MLKAIESAVHNLRPPLLVYPVTSFKDMRSPAIARAAVEGPASTTAGTATATTSATTQGDVVRQEGSGNGATSTSSGGRRNTGGVLQHCLLLRPSTTAGDVFTAMKKPPLAALSGDFVRAEYYDVQQGEPRQIKRGATLSQHTAILRIMTTKKRQHVPS